MNNERKTDQDKVPGTRASSTNYVLSTMWAEPEARSSLIGDCISFHFTTDHGCGFKNIFSKM